MQPMNPTECLCFDASEFLAMSTIVLVMGRILNVKSRVTAVKDGTPVACTL
jgi:hypothetical protein